MASTPPSSPSWISFSPDAPHTPTPSKAAHNDSSPSGRSYTRPKAPAYFAPTPSSLPRLESPPRRVDALISGATPGKGSEKDDLSFFASSARGGSDDDDDNDESSKGFKDNRFSVFLKISTVPTGSPTSSDSESHHFSSSAPSSTLSTPTDLSSAFSTRDEIIEAVVGSFTGAPDAATKSSLLPLAWRAPSPTSSPTRGLFDPRQPGVEAGGSWEDELYTALPDVAPRVPATPGKSPRHPYYANRPSPRSPTRSRRGSARSGSLVHSPTTPRYDISASFRSARRPSYATSPRSPTRGIAKKKAGVSASKKAVRASRKAARKAADRLPITDLHGYQMDALDNFFGVTPMGSKVLRCGYSGIGVEEVEGGWKRTAEFRPLLRDEDEDDQLDSPEPAQGCFGIACDYSSDSETTKKRRPPPLDLSRSRSRSVSLASNASDGDILSGRTTATPGPHILSPDPLSKEIRRRASEAALRTAKVSDGNSGQKSLKTKKSMGKILKAAWLSLVDGGAEERVRKQAAGAGDFF